MTEPVGVGLPLALLTTTVTINACDAVIVDEDGVTVTVGDGIPLLRFSFAMNGLV